MPIDNTDDLADGLARIQALSTSELRSLVVSTTGKPPSRQLSGDLLRRMLSHRLQTQVAETKVDGLPASAKNSFHWKSAIT